MEKVARTLVIALVFVGTAWGRSPEAVQPWLDRAVQESRQLPLAGEYQIRWRSINTRPVDPVALAALRHEVKGVLQHPRKADLEVMEMAARGNPIASPFRLWYGGPGRWRVNLDENNQPSAKGVWVDKALTDRHSWQLGSKALNVYSGGGRQRGAPSDADENWFVPEVGMFLTGGLLLVSRSRLTIEPVTTDGPRWSATAYRLGRDGERSYELRFSGTWDGEVGLVERIVNTRNSFLVEREGTTQRLSGWKWNPNVDRWVASVVEEFDRNQRPTRRLELLEIVREPEGTIDRVTTIPSLARGDAVRGALTVREVRDLTEGASATRAEASATEERLAPSTAMPVTDRWGWVRLAGWIAVGAIVAALIWIRVRRTGL